MNDVFISYSRRNKEFTRKLYEALIASERTVWADWDSIPAASDWFAEIKQGIEQTNTVLFVLSPEWIKSNECRKELSHSIAMGKRLLPILFEMVDPNEVPPELAKINWIYMREGDDFETAFQTLLKAMDTDLDWIKSHTRIQVRAVEWEKKNKDHSFVLRGKDLTDGEQFIAGGTGKTPEVTPLQGEYILISRKDATRRQRMTLAGVVTALIVSIALGVVAVFQWRDAVAAKQAAEAAQTKAEQEEARAVAAQLIAEAETRAANAGRLALESENALNQHPQRALLLALEAVKVNQDANEDVLPDSEEALRLALTKVSGIGLTGFEHEVNLIQFTKDNQWLVAGTNTIGGEIKIWDVEQASTDPTYQPYYLNFPVETNQDLTYSIYYWLPTINVSPQTEWLILASPTQTKIYLIADEDETREPITFTGKIEFTNPNDDSFILEDQGDKAVYWEIDPQTLTKKEIFTFNGSLVKLSDDRSLLITDDSERGLLLWDFAALSSTPILLTEKHVSDFTYSTISPDNEWFIAFQNRERPEYQIPVYDAYGAQTGTQPWESTDIVLIPLTQTKKQEFVVELNFSADLTTEPKFSEDAKSFLYRATNPPDQFGTYSGNALGILRFEGLEFINLTASSKTEFYNQVSFIKNDWLYVEELNNSTYEATGKFFDLREEDLFANGQSPLLLLMDEQGNVTFSEDEKYLITQSGDFINFHQLEFNQAIIVEPASQISETQSINELELEIQNNYKNLGMENFATQTAISQNEMWFAAGGYDGSVRLWNYQSPSIDTNLKLKSFPNYISLSNDNQWLSTSGTLYQLQNGIPAKTIQITEQLDEYGYSNVHMVVFSPDSHWLVYFSYNPNTAYEDDVYLVDLNQVLETGELNARKISATSSLYTTVQFSNDSQWVLVSMEITNATSEDIKNASFLYSIENQKYYELSNQVDTFTFTEEQNHIVLGLAEIQGYSIIATGIEIWSLPTPTNDKLEKVGEIEIDGSYTISRNGHWAITTVPDSTQAESNLYDLRCIINNTECNPFVLQAERASFSPDSKSLLTLRRETIESELLIYEIWGLENNQPEKIHSETDEYTLPSKSQSGDLILYTKLSTTSFSFPSFHTAGSFTTWSGYDNTGQNVTSFDGYGHVFYGGGGGGGGAFGGYQADYSVEAFDTSSKTSIDLRGHESNISASFISPDENFVLTFSGSLKDDGTGAEKLIRLWDMQKMRLNPTQKPIVLPLSLDSDYGALTAIAFSPNSEWVYVVDNNNVLYYYPISIEVLKEQACFALGRNLTFSEWERFFLNTPYRKTCENLPEHPSAIR